MKKIISIIFVLALCASLMVTAAYAADTTVITLDTVQSCDETTIEINVVIENNPGIGAMEGEIVYDAEKLELTAITGGILNGDFFIPTVEDNYFAFMSLNGVDGEGTLFTLTFNVLEEGAHEVALEIVDLYTASATAIEHDVVDGSISLGHVAGETVIENETGAVCEDAGSYDKVVYCEVCGEELSRETITVEAPGHTEGDVVIENEEPADCVNDGSYDEVVYCEVCGEELSRETITVDALGHTEGEAVIENEASADCVTGGSYDVVVYCEVCGEELSRETIPVPATGKHTEGDKVIENETYDVHGELSAYDEVWYCAVCNNELKRVHVEIPAGEHNWRDIVIAPSCDEWGCTLHICVDGDCTASYTSNYVPALGHTFGEYVSNNDATCTEDGTKTAKCVRCDVTDTIADEGSAKGHGSFSVKFNSWPTCTEDADWDVFCEACGIQIADEEWQNWGTINGWKATGHKWADATCTEAKHCTVCGETEGEALGHGDYTVVYNGGPTCTEHANITVTCNGCGYVVPAEEWLTWESFVGMDKLGHDFGEATCSEPATCSRCGETTGETLAHTWADATCTTPKTCTVCGETEGELLEHAGEWVIVKEAQIGEAGLKQLICTVCGEVIAEEEIPALEEPAPTSDSMILLFVISAMAAMTGAAVLVMKKKYF